MGKKTLVLAYLLVLSLGTILSLYMPKNEAAAKDAIVIPGQAIRLRILANSDLNADQQLKRDVRDAVNAKISVWVKDLTSIKQARKVIESHLPELKSTAEEVVKEHGSTQTVKIKFGKVQFPTKLYGQFLYPAGDYEAVLITLGKGEGANWWCVLFPPLCFLDFSNGVAVSNGFDGKDASKDKKDVKTTPETSSSPDKQQSAPNPVQVHSVSSDTSAAQSTSSDQAVSPATASAQAGAESTVSVQAAAQSTSSGQAATQSTASDQTVSASAAAPKTEAKAKKHKKHAPVYTTEDEQPIKVKFFALELWQKLF